MNEDTLSGLQHQCHQAIHTHMAYLKGSNEGAGEGFSRSCRSATFGLLGSFVARYPVVPGRCAPFTTGFLLSSLRLVSIRMNLQAFLPTSNTHFREKQNAASGAVGRLCSAH